MDDDGFPEGIEHTHYMYKGRTVSKQEVDECLKMLHYCMLPQVDNRPCQSLPLAYSIQNPIKAGRVGSIQMVFAHFNKFFALSSCLILKSGLHSSST